MESGTDLGNPLDTLIFATRSSKEVGIATFYNLFIKNQRA